MEGFTNTNRKAAALVAEKESLHGATIGRAGSPFLTFQRLIWEGLRLCRDPDHERRVRPDLPAVSAVLQRGFPP